jgi:hypothetical protein
MFKVLPCTQQPLVCYSKWGGVDWATGASRQVVRGSTALYTSNPAYCYTHMPPFGRGSREAPASKPCVCLDTILRHKMPICPCMICCPVYAACLQWLSSSWADAWMHAGRWHHCCRCAVRRWAPVSMCCFKCPTLRIRLFVLSATAPQSHA